LPIEKNLEFRRRANFIGTKFGDGKIGIGKQGRAKIPSPQPPSFLPARTFSLAREARRQFRSKKVWSRMSITYTKPLYAVTNPL